MGNHRAERRDTSRRPSDLPTPHEGTATPTGGKRRADKAPRRSAHVDPKPVAATVLYDDEATQVMAITAAAPVAEPSRGATYQTSRITGVRVATPARTGPSKPGARRSSSRAPILRGVPSLPILAGVAALAIAAGGALTAAGSLSTDESPRFSQASALSGASDVSRVSLLDRSTVSRDSRRDALADASDAELQNVVEKQDKQRQAALAKLAQLTQQQADKLRLNQWQLPVSGYHLTARFGESSGLWSSYHTGLDFAAPSGTPIHAVANGVVTSVGYDGSYGNKTVITLDDGTELWYCHQTSYLVSAGQEVHVGDEIGTVGSTGNTTGPHLHLEVRPGGGDPVDPYAALVVHGLQP